MEKGLESFKYCADVDKTKYSESSYCSLNVYMRVVYLMFSYELSTQHSLENCRLNVLLRIVYSIFSWELSTQCSLENFLLNVLLGIFYSMVS